MSVPWNTNKATFFEAAQCGDVFSSFNSLSFHQSVQLLTFLSKSSGNPPASTGFVDAPHRLSSLPAKPEEVTKLYATSILWISWSKSVLSSLPFSLYALLTAAVGLILILSEVCKSEQSPVPLSEMWEQTSWHGVRHYVLPIIPFRFAAKGNS